MRFRVGSEYRGLLCREMMAVEGHPDACVSPRSMRIFGNIAETGMTDEDRGYGVLNTPRRFERVSFHLQRLLRHVPKDPNHLLVVRPYTILPTSNRNLEPAYWSSQLA